jgi:glycosyltransferase involved in cell wall biosynthesis
MTEGRSELDARRRLPTDTLPFQRLPKGDTTMALPAEAETPRVPIEKVMLISEKLAGSGIAGYTQDLANALIAHGIKVALAAPCASDPARYASMGCETFFSPRCLWGKWAFLCFRSIRDFACRFAPRIIHAQSAFASNLACSLAEVLNVPCVITCHHILKAGQLSLTPACRQLIAVSQVVRENLVNDARVPKDRIHLIPVGIDISRFKRHRCDCSSVPIVAAIGTLTKRKAFNYFIEAARLLLDRGVNAKFLLAGEGPEERNLRRLAARLDMERHLTFYTHPIDIATLISEADVIVHTSLQEGFGVGVLEALASGVPVVAAGVGGVYDVLKDGETGYIVPAGDARAIADKVRVLIEDNDLRIRMGDAGRALVEKEFSIGKMVADTLDVYEEALGEEPGR